MDFSKDLKEKSELKKAAKIINEGGVVVFPTDTVYGFLADEKNKKATEKIFKIKKRPRSKPLPVFIKDIKMAKQIAEISPAQEKVLKKYWPGAYTFLLRPIVIPAKAGIQSKSTDSRFRVKPGMTSLIIKNNKIALRLPNHKLLLKLLNKVNRPLAQTSVNISGKPTMTKIKEIKKVFGGNTDVSFIFDGGNLPKQKPSVIIDLTKEKIKIIRK